MERRRMVQRSRRVGAAIGIVTLSIGLSGCTPGNDSPPIVSVAELQKDLTGRLVKQGRPPMAVTCTKDLVGEPGRSVQCDVAFTNSNSMEAVIETTTVNGDSVQYEIRPRVTQGQTERLLTALTGARSVVCDSGLDDRLATMTHCEVDQSGSISLRAVTAEKLGDLQLNLMVFQLRSQVQVEEQLRRLIAASSGEAPKSVECAGGLLGKKDTSVECVVSFEDARKTYNVSVTAVEGDNVTLGAEPKFGDGPGSEEDMDYCRGCPG